MSKFRLSIQDNQRYTLYFYTLIFGKYSPITLRLGTANARGIDNFTRSFRERSICIKRSSRCCFLALHHAHYEPVLLPGEEGQHERAGRGLDALWGYVLRSSPNIGPQPPS
jgi:hypothetical protein